jgi:hypothetical protein
MNIEKIKNINVSCLNDGIDWYKTDCYSSILIGISNKHSGIYITQPYKDVREIKEIINGREVPLECVCIIEDLKMLKKIMEFVETLKVVEKI